MKLITDFGLPLYEEINMDGCESGKYTLFIEDFDNTFLYSDFELE